MKRLFTPEIKRLLKDWLVRRRENPYPSRDEKKNLAVETGMFVSKQNLTKLLQLFLHLLGLTYTQICNWFANWRRKLKNTCEQKKSWGNLIKNYNFNARGNVEQFEINSADSIWGEGHESLDSDLFNQDSDSEAQDLTKATSDMHFDDQQFKAALTSMAQALPNGSFFNSQNSAQFAMNFLAQQCFQISSTTNEMQQSDPHKQQYFTNSTKFKNHIMEKYLRGLDDETNNNNNEDINMNDGQLPENDKKPELSKWLESTANFQPSKNNYNIDFVKSEKNKKKAGKSCASLCEKELIAAETLVLLKNNFRTKFYNS